MNFQMISLPILFDADNEHESFTTLSMFVRLALKLGMDREYLNDYCRSNLSFKYYQYAMDKYDFLRQEKIENKHRNERLVSMGDKNHIGKTRVSAYERLAIVPIEEVVKNIGKTITVKGHSIYLGSKRLRCYAAKGVVCVRCGIAGSYFSAERARLDLTTTKYHLNLYHKCVDGGEKMITVDHITPKSRGGAKSHLSNLQPMCLDCNGRKGNRLESEIKEIH